MNRKTIGLLLLAGVGVYMVTRPKASTPAGTKSTTSGRPSSASSPGTWFGDLLSGAASSLRGVVSGVGGFLDDVGPGSAPGRGSTEWHPWDGDLE